MENGTILPVRVRERESESVCVGERERPILLRAATEQALAEVYVVHICLHDIYIEPTERLYIYGLPSKRATERERVDKRR